MFWVLLTVFIAGIAGAGIGLGLRKLSRDRLPRGVIPVAAGIAMIAATIGTEYGWYPNVVRTMPADLVVISQREQQAWYQPWTFVRPWVRGFISYSPSEMAETAEGSDVYVVQIRQQERWQPQIVRPILVDCNETRRAEIRPETEFSPDGEPTNVAWLDVSSDDPILSAVCEGDASAS